MGEGRVPSPGLPEGVLACRQLADDESQFVETEGIAGTGYR